jgi:molybdopterin converting factor small subunit
MTDKLTMLTFYKTLIDDSCRRRENQMKKEPIRVKINSCYTVGQTDTFRSKFGNEDDFIIELDPGTTVEDLLLQIPGIGSPEEWDDLMLHVFVNRRIVGFDKVLKDDDVVDLHIPSSGG